MANRLLAIVGPTAVGKTAVGIECALRLNGEIVSADSAAIYRGMDLGTAKPTPEERAKVAHHLIDLIDPDEEFSVAQYKARAEAAIDDILRRGKEPLLVGGSGLYVRAVVGRWGMTLAPRDNELRERLQTEAREKGLAALHARLAEIDPESAVRISVADEKRVIRALEVHEITGLPMSHFHRLDRARQPRYDSTIIGLTLARDRLYRRIEERIERMLQAGLLEEVARLREKGYHTGLTSMKALGYAHLLAHLEGKYDLPTAVELLKRDSRRFAKRQLTWFRAEEGIRWIDVGDRSAADVAEEIVGGLG